MLWSVEAKMLALGIKTLLVKIIYATHTNCWKC